VQQEIRGAVRPRARAPRYVELSHRVAEAFIPHATVYPETPNKRLFRPAQNLEQT
jgi:hypothetical protein